MSAPTSTRRAHAGLFLASLFWGSAFAGSKAVLQELTPLGAAAPRLLLAGLLLLPAAIRSWSSADVRAVFWPLGGITVTGVAYTWLFFHAVERAPATTVALLVALNPTLTAIGAALLGERIPARRAVAAVVALAGAWTVITHGNWAVIGTLGNETGEVLALVAAVVWALYNLLATPILARTTPAVTNCVSFLLGSLLLYALAWGEDPVGQLVGASWATRLGLVYLAAVPSVAGSQLFLVGIQHLGVATAAPYINLVPLHAAWLSALLLGERIGWVEAIGGGVILLGLWLGGTRTPRSPSSSTD